VWIVAAVYSGLFRGATLSSLFHPRIVRDRKFAVLLAIVIALVAYTKGEIAKDFPVTRFFLWIFPPVYDVFKLFDGKEYFSISILIVSILLGMVYGIIMVILQLYLLKKNKF
jgi:hypothetical protein